MNLPQILHIEAKAAKATPTGLNAREHSVDWDYLMATLPPTVTQLCKMARAYLELREEMEKLRDPICTVCEKEYTVTTVSGGILPVLARADEILGKP